MGKFTDGKDAMPKNSPAMKAGSAGGVTGRTGGKAELTDGMNEMPRNSPALKGKPVMADKPGSLPYASDRCSEEDLRKGYKTLKMPAATNNSPDKGGFND